MKGTKVTTTSSTKGYPNQAGEAVYLLEHAGEQTWYIYGSKALITWEALAKEAKENASPVPVLYVGRSPNAMKKIR